MKFDEMFPLKVFINLDKRKDRLAECKVEFQKLGINPIRKPGFVPDNIDNPWWKGAVGCMVSHYQIIQAAAMLDTNVFIFEDDIMFRDDKNISFIIESACNELDNMKWDFLYMAANILKPFKQVSPHLAKLTHAQSTCAYGINKKFLNTVLENIHLDKIDRPIDVIYSDLAPFCNFYITVPMVGVQRDSFSDIEQTEVNYTNYLQKRYDENLIRLPLTK